MPLDEGVSIEDAILAMESKAAELNLKLVGRQDVSKELQTRGVETPYLSILQFCDPMDARTMIVSNPIFASYMPCRIALVEDQEKIPMLMMLNFDMLIGTSEMEPIELVDVKVSLLFDGLVVRLPSNAMKSLRSQNTRLFQASNHNQEEERDENKIGPGDIRYLRHRTVYVGHGERNAHGVLHYQHRCG